MDQFFEITKYEPQLDSKETLNDLVNQAYQLNRSFFNHDISVGIDFLYSREEMDHVAGSKTAEWVVGRAQNSRVKIFSPSVYDKVSSHPLSDFPLVLAHEIAHIFIAQLYGFKCPVWLNEGIAGYVAGQYKNKVIREDRIQGFEALHGYGFWNEHPNYNQAYLFTSFLLENMGKDKLLEFCTQLGEKDTYGNFCNKFEEKFGLAFSECNNKWIQQLNSQQRIKII